MNKNMPKHAGEVGILNVGDGDTKLSFDPKNPAERIRAARIVKDMLRRGYALLIETGRDGDDKPVYARAIDFKEDVCEYVIADLDPVTAAEHDEQEAQDGQQEQTQSSSAPAAGAPAAQSRRRVVKRAIPASSTRAVAVAPTAGG